MANLIEIGFDYAVIDEDGRDDVRAAAERIKVRMSRTVEDIIDIGRDLIAVKKSIGHGNFLRWIEVEFGMTDRTARNFMSACERFGSKTEMVSDLTVGVLYALAAPSTDDAVVEEVIERAEAGEKITPDDVKALKAEWASERKDLKRQIDDAKAKAKDAQATGVDYGHQIEELRGELVSLRDERDTLKQELRSARSGAVGAVKTVAPYDASEAKEHQVASLMSAWNKAGQEAREEFLSRIDGPVMDRRFG